jgi:deoxyadenosine/deoxycytidine kinase
MFLESGVITPGEFALLDRWFGTLTSPTITGMGVDLIIYIRSDPDILMDRINARGRQVKLCA